MYINRVRVRNFRSIKDTGWVDVEEDVTTLLGKNESGKTAFLEAIEGFESEGGYEEIDIRESNNFPDPILPVCSIEFGLEEPDQKRLSRFDSSLGKMEFLPVTKFAEGTLAVDPKAVGYKLPRVLLNVAAIKSIIGELTDKLQELGGVVNQDAISALHQTRSNIQNLDGESSTQFPKLVQKYMEEISGLIAEINSLPDDYSSILNLHKRLSGEADRIDEGKISASDVVALTPSFFYHNEANLLKDEIPLRAIENEEYRTFRNLLTEVAGIDLEEFRSKEQMEKFRVMDKVTTTITGEVNELWSQKRVNIDINFDGNTFYTFIKDLGVEEEEVNRKPRNPSQRSQGFQWFLSFYINLTAVSESNRNQVMMLLDDPAVFLHPEGKKNWLTAIESIAEDNQVIYTSHSPYLIRKEYPSRIRIVEDQKEQGTEILKEFAGSSSTSLEPLREALGIGLGDSPFVSQRKVLVEGPSDYFILNGLANYSADHIDSDILGRSDVTILPTGGGDEMVWASKWVNSEQFSYAILLDNDQKGNTVENRIQDEAAEIDENRIFKLMKNDGERNYNIEIEDMFDPMFYIDCLNAAYEAEYDWYEAISIQQSGDVWEIEGEEHNGRKITNLVDDIFDRRGYSGLDKVLVSHAIESRLNQGEDVSPEDVEAFNEVLGGIRSVL